MRDARIEFDWADDTYAFRMAWGQLAELQERCDAGAYAIRERLLDGTWRVQDVSNILRLGLIGGGMKPEEALKKVRVYVEERPPIDNLPFAIAVLSAGLIGAPEEPVGEREAASPAEEKSKASRTESSDLPPSTEPAPPSATRRRKSTK